MQGRKVQRVCDGALLHTVQVQELHQGLQAAAIWDNTQPHLFPEGGGEGSREHSTGTRVCVREMRLWFPVNKKKRCGFGA